MFLFNAILKLIGKDGGLVHHLKLHFHKETITGVWYLIHSMKDTQNFIIINVRSHACAIQKKLSVLDTVVVVLLCGKENIALYGYCDYCTSTALWCSDITVMMTLMMQM